MGVNIRPELKAFVEEKVREGLYPNLDAMMEEALTLLYARMKQPAPLTSEHESDIRGNVSAAQGYEF